jgi:ELWxxDGT repeat protein
MTVVGGKLYFAAPDNGKQNLYSYDGVNLLYSRQFLPQIQWHKSDVACGIQGQALFCRTFFRRRHSSLRIRPRDRTAAPVDTAKISPFAPVVVGNTLYFIGNQLATLSELYSYDGSSISRLTDLAPGAKHGVLNRLAAYKGEVYFGGSVDGTDFQLYKYDTQSHSAVLVHTLNPSGNGDVGELIAYKSSLYFTARAAATGIELWKYNGSSCSIVADIWPGTMGGFFKPKWASPYLTGHLYFTASDGTMDLSFGA